MERNNCKEYWDSYYKFMAVYLGELQNAYPDVDIKKEYIEVARLFEPSMSNDNMNNSSQTGNNQSTGMGTGTSGGNQSTGMGTGTTGGNQSTGMGTGATGGNQSTGMGTGTTGGNQSTGMGTGTTGGNQSTGMGTGTTGGGQAAQPFTSTDGDQSIAPAIFPGGGPSFGNIFFPGGGGQSPGQSPGQFISPGGGQFTINNCRRMAIVRIVMRRGFNPSEFFMVVDRAEPRSIRGFRIACESGRIRFVPMAVEYRNINVIECAF